MTSGSSYGDHTTECTERGGTLSVKVIFVGSGDSFGAGGKFTTCILVDAPGIRFAIDFGASSLIALSKLGIDHNSIDVIFLTHFHGDHCGGVPFLLLDAMLAAKRLRPLAVVGPRGTKSRLTLIGEALFPGMYAMTPKFRLDYVEMDVLETRDVNGIKFTSYPALHTPETNPTSIRIEVAGKAISYTGDSDWTPHMPTLAENADLLVAECYFYQKPVRHHLTYSVIKRHWHELKAKRVILTHFSREMIAHKDEIPEECAYDGLTVYL